MNELKRTGIHSRYQNRYAPSGGNRLENRRRLVDIITPLYFGRTGTYCAEVMEKTWEETEETVKEQVELFRENRNYLINKFKSGR